ncbi:MAG: hypothetical protein M3O15_04780 [Acidobacteriota bacterium]|nr:hypothetical protein [Acidobacteriota bacterium]
MDRSARRCILASLAVLVVPVPARLGAVPPPPCVADDTTLCLDDRPGDGRYQVRMTYRTAEGGGLAGSGHAVSLAAAGFDNAGAFWLFSAQNPEVLLKLLDACAISRHHWLFASAVTNVGYEIVVTDTFTGAKKSYGNPDRMPAEPVQDTAAFDCADPCGSPGVAPFIAGFGAGPASVVTGAPETFSWMAGGAGPLVQSLTGTELPNLALASGDRRFSFAPQSPGPHTATLTVTGRCGGASAVASFDVQPACSMPHVDFFSACSTSYCAGQTATLSWHTTGSGDTSILPGVGAVAPAGSVAVPANSTTVYTLSKTGACGADSAMVTVTVEQPATVVSFSSDSASVPFGGGTTLRFDITGSVSYWTLSDSLGNIPAFVHRGESGSLTYAFTASDRAGNDVVTLAACGGCNPGCDQRSLTISVN